MILSKRSIVKVKWALVFFITSAQAFAGGGPGGGGNMGGGDWTDCGPGNWYDTGGSGANYSNSELITETYCSDVAGDCIEFTFTSFSTESCCDDLTIYDGPNTGSPLIGTYAGTALPNGGTITSSTGCLTFVFDSDFSVTNPGWVCSYTCVPCPVPTCSDGIQNQGETGIDCGGPCPPCPPIMGNGSWNDCGPGTHYDSGGSGGAYSNNELITETYCSDVTGDCIEFNFTTFNTESCCDDLTIYDGPNTGSPLIGTFAGTALPNGGTITSTSGCLTFVFDSDGSVTNPGWAANFTCVTCPTCSDGIQNGNEAGVDCGGPTCPPCPCDDIPIAALPYSNTGVNTATYGDRYSSADACGSSYLNGNEAIFEYTPSANESVNIIISNQSTTSAGLFVWDNCPDAAGVNCVEYTTGSNLAINCLTLNAGTTYYIGLSTWPSPQTMTFDIDITLNAGGPPSCGLNYTYSTIAYNPVNYNSGSLLSFSDDRMADAYTSIGFPFCYDGVQYQDVLVSSNGYLLFPGCYSAHPFGTERGPTDYSPYSINAAAPNTTDAPVNAIMGPWQDIYPSGSAVDGEIRTLTTGAGPNRRFSATFKDVRMFSCTSLDFNGQISLYETTDNIEVHMLEKTVCSTFNGGAAIMGITDYTGTNAIIPGGYNYPTQWTVNPGSPEGHLFSSNCGPCTILPVELMNFSAKNFGDYNQVSWETATEINNDYFVLERSNGGAMFYELATIDGAGNSSTLLEYEYKHTNPETLEYYRLRQVDFDGKISYSKIISVRRKGQVEIDIYPNPTKDILKVDFVTEENETYTIVIADLLGKAYQTTFTTSGTNKQLIIKEFRSFAQGFYSIKVMDNENRIVKMDKIIKN